MPPTKGTYVPMAEAENVPRESCYRDAYMEFSVQPASEFRFRYPSEFTKGSHGSLKSAAEKGKKPSKHTCSHPAIKIYKCKAEFYLQAKLYTPDKTQPHVYKLVESSKIDESSGCVFFPGTPVELGNFVEIELANLNILQVGKEKLDAFVKETVTAQMKKDKVSLDYGCYFQEKTREYKKSVENLVCVGVDLIVNKKIVTTVFSEVISNAKSQNAKQLHIVHISRVAGVCSGGEEVMIFNNKLRAEDINKATISESDVEVVFFERDQLGNVIWQKFGELTFNHQLMGLVFKTPPYRLDFVDNPVDVIIQLQRKNDPESWSNEISFSYVPSDESDLKRKRARTMSYQVQETAARVEQPAPPPPDMEVDPAACLVVQLNEDETTIHQRSQYSMQGRLKRGFDESEHQAVLVETSNTPQYAPVELVAVHYEVCSEVDVSATGIDDDYQDRVVRAVTQSAFNQIESDPKLLDLIDRAIGTGLMENSHDPMLAAVPVRLFAQDGKQVMSDHVSETRIITNTSSTPEQPVVGASDGDQFNSADLQRSDEPEVEEKKDESVLGAEMFSLQAYKLALQTAHCLHNYAKTGDISILLMSMRHLIAIQDDKGDNSLHASVIYSQEEAIRRLVEVARTIADYDIINMANRYNQTPLHVAVCTRQTTAVEILLNHGANPNAADKSGNTAIHLAARRGDSRCLAAILDPRYTTKYRGTKPNLDALNYAGMSPLHVAIEGGSNSAAKLLSKAGCDVNLRDRKSGRAALHMAVERKDLEIIDHLLNLQADTDVQMFNGDTPLHLAVIQDRSDMVGLLMAAGADPFIENLESAAQVVEEEVDDDESGAGLPIDELVDRGLTPMDLAVSEEVRRLLRREKVQAASVRSVSQEVVAPVASKAAEPEKGSNRNLMDSGIGLSGMDMSSGMSVGGNSSMSVKDSDDRKHASVAAALGDRQKNDLAKLLDPASWRMLAGFMELDDKLISDIGRRESPTGCLLELIEDKNKLCFYLDAAGLKDALNVIESSGSEEIVTGMTKLKLRK